MLFVFWGAVASVAYAYVGFPALLAVRSVVRPRPWRRSAGAAHRPTVTVVIAAHNEEAAIGAKVANVLHLDYPADRLDVVVASDGSDDATVAEAVRAGGDRTVVLDLPRSGKAAALNHGVEVASGEIVVFTDANSRLADDAVTRLVAPFADPAVGGVAGDQRYQTGDGTGTADASDGGAEGERAYWNLDRWLKMAESRSGNVISATGALYAVRRDLTRPIPDGVTDDFAMSTGVIDQGRRLVFEPGAVAWEPPSPALGGEYRRKVRVMTRGFRSVILRRRLLDPRRSGFYAVQLLSHKVLRRLVALPLLVALAASVPLRRRGPLYALALAAQVLVHGLGLAGVALSGSPAGRRRILSIPAFFTMVNAASLHAVANILTGRRIDRWTPARGTRR